ncbi:MAG: 3-oxoacid CoA-transferase subunit A [Rhodospirillaceae bacterium]|nr:3-oxoacid CoA-transferase subunit A [Rhodospirillaceae bacterium]MBT7956234.1 3-oxoacid CoA-transferase subunit A [Rhodospirillaceae bacterium]
MIDKTVATIEDAVAGISDGSTLMVSGFGEAGAPVELMEAIIEQGARNLTIVSNNAGEAYHGLAKLVNEKRVVKVICSFPTAAKKAVIKDLYAAGEIELEIVPQGTLSERIRAGGAGIGGFYTPTSFGTKLAEGKETRQFDGQDYVLEFPLFADFAFVKAFQADRWGNLTYDKSARNFGPSMAMAGETTVVQVSEIVELGELDPERVVTPGIFVDRVVKLSSPNRISG